MIPLAQFPVIGRTDLEVAPRGSDRRSGPVSGDVLTSERSARADVYEISIVPADSVVRLHGVLRPAALLLVANA
jgi:hypothetical protein